MICLHCTLDAILFGIQLKIRHGVRRSIHHDSKSCTRLRSKSWAIKSFASISNHFHQ